MSERPSFLESPVRSSTLKKGINVFFLFGNSVNLQFLPQPVSLSLLSKCSQSASISINLKRETGSGAYRETQKGGGETEGEANIEKNQLFL